MAHLTRDPIDLSALLATVSDPSRGGVATFLGTVRAAPEDGPVTCIEYSAFEAMAESEMAKIVSEAEGRWPGSRAAAVHRLGPVPLGEASIGIAAAAPHRGDAFEACRYVIEEAKRRLPVWKKEHFADGSTAWRENDPAAHSSSRTS